MQLDLIHFYANVADINLLKNFKNIVFLAYVWTEKWVLAGKTQSNHLWTTFNGFYGQKYEVSGVDIKCVMIYRHSVCRDTVCKPDKSRGQG